MRHQTSSTQIKMTKSRVTHTITQNTRPAINPNLSYTSSLSPCPSSLPFPISPSLPLPLSLSPPFLSLTHYLSFSHSLPLSPSLPSLSIPLSISLSPSLPRSPLSHSLGAHYSNICVSQSEIFYLLYFLCKRNPLKIYNFIHIS